MGCRPLTLPGRPHRYTNHPAHLTLNPHAYPSLYGGGHRVCLVIRTAALATSAVLRPTIRRLPESTYGPSKRPSPQIPRDQRSLYPTLSHLVSSMSRSRSNRRHQKQARTTSTTCHQSFLLPGGRRTQRNAHSSIGTEVMCTGTGVWASFGWGPNRRCWISRIMGTGLEGRATRLLPHGLL